jgi:AcrR family transcriptional regulator
MATRSNSFALSRKDLYQRVWSKPISVVAKEMGLSGNALSKICNRLSVPYPTRGHWAKVSAGKRIARPVLPEAPEPSAAQITISAVRAGSRRSRSRLTPQVRRDQLVAVAECIIAKQGLHAASMKQIAATAGISETQAYNYFGSRDQLLVELARREFAKIREARRKDFIESSDHYERIIRTTRTYLREIGQRGGLLQTLLSSPNVRSMLRDEHREQQDSALRAHAQSLVDRYGIPRSVALGCTAVLTTLCLRAGKLIADKRIPVEAGERMCIAMMVQGSRDIVTADRAA